MPFVVEMHGRGSSGHVAGCLGFLGSIMPDRPEELGSGRAPRRGSDGSQHEAGIPDTRFDRWLSCRLHDAYDGVLKEQMPADLARLVAMLGAQSDPDTQSQPAANEAGHAHGAQAAPMPAGISNGFDGLRNFAQGYRCGSSAEE
ncbi:MAG: hypothetical protein U1E17_00855 [Geminicoccaceae bacterium]